MGNRNRKDYSKTGKPIPGVYFDDRPNPGVIFIEEKQVDIEGIKKDYYKADNIGNLYNAKGDKIKPKTINSGYLVYGLITDDTTDKKYKNILAHRLFAKTFMDVENSDNLTVDHINGNPNDNSTYNLRWVTQKENNDHMYQVTPNDGTSNYQSKFNHSQLEIIVKCLDEGMQYSKILKEIGIEVTDNNEDSIGNIKRGITYKKEVAEIRNSLSSSTTDSDECKSVELK